eukprot:scaffold44413_cov41-Phaeocystis_antarctica.AAC.2
MTRVSYDGTGTQVAYDTGVIWRCPGGICHGCHMTVPRWHMTPRVSYGLWRCPGGICHGCHMSPPGGICHGWLKNVPHGGLVARG